MVRYPGPSLEPSGVVFWELSHRAATGAHLVGAKTESSYPARRRCMKRNRRLFLVALAALLVLPFALPSAASADTVAQKRAHARAIMGELATLDVKMEKVVERYDAATGKLATINASIAKNQRTLALTRYNLQMAKTQLQNRVVAMYKQRPVELLDVMLATKSFSSMVDQLDLLDRVGTSDSTMVDSIGDYQTTIVATQKTPRDRPHGRRTARGPARHRKGRGRKRPGGATVDAARRQGADRPARRPAGPGGQAGRPEAGRRAADRPPSTPTTAAWWPSPRASWARCPTCGAALRPPASTARASRCTSTPTSA